MSSTQEQSGRSALAIAAFVIGLLGIPLSFFPFGMFVGPLAIVLGVLALNRSGHDFSSRRMARGGVIFGIAGTLIWLTIYGLLALFAS